MGKKIDRTGEKSIEKGTIQIYTFLSMIGLLNMVNIKILKKEMLNVRMNLEFMEWVTQEKENIKCLKMVNMQINMLHGMIC